MQESQRICLTDSTGRDLPLLLLDRCFWVIGREKSCEIMLPSPSVSRKHAILQRDERGEFYLVDLGSKNGSFVNGRRVGLPARVKNGDAFKLGQLEFTFHCPDAATEPQPADGDALAEMTMTVQERKLISVLVVDVRNFTVLTRHMAEEQFSRLLGEWFAEVGEAVQRHGGWVDKFIGDAVMAIWSHPANEQPKVQTLSLLAAVLEVHRATTALNEKFAPPVEFRVGAGINTGFAVMTNAGGNTHRAITALGDTVNAAFRLESATKEIGADIALGEETFHALAGTAAATICRPAACDLKGYSNPISIYSTTFAQLATAM